MNNASVQERVAYNIGLVVIRSQYLEKNLKLIVAAMKQIDANTLPGRLDSMQRRPLGQVVKEFVAGTTVQGGNIADVETYFSRLVSRRNDVVHHFFEAFGADLAAGNEKRVLRELARLCEDLLHVAECFRGVNDAFLDNLQVSKPN